MRESLVQGISAVLFVWFHILRLRLSLVYSFPTYKTYCYEHPFGFDL